MSGNVCLDLVMLALKDLISTPLCSNLNVTINLQWNKKNSMHMTLINFLNDQNISSFDDSNSENEDRNLYTNRICDT
jgi:hypothetical protein